MFSDETREKIRDEIYNLLQREPDKIADCLTDIADIYIGVILAKIENPKLGIPAPDEDAICSQITHAIKGALKGELVDAAEIRGLCKIMQGMSSNQINYFLKTANPANKISAEFKKEMSSMSTLPLSPFSPLF